VLACVVGLGNPGPAYATTRHNLGFAVLDTLVAARGGAWRRRCWRPYWLADAPVADGMPQRYCKPATFMNRSGIAVAALCRQYGYAPADLLLVYDDLHLPLGCLRARATGSAGGHNGMQSVMDALGTEAVPRLRLGIGPPAADAIAHVLGPFAAHEQARVAGMLAAAAAAIPRLCCTPWEQAVARVNSPPPGAQNTMGLDATAPGQQPANLN
jgi:PTH1 family peptidyl-tRNA hydrolase